MNDIDIEALLLSPAAKRKVVVLIMKLVELDEVTNKIQCADVTI